MNKTRRAQIEECAETLRGLMDEEQEYLDNMPESFQNGEKGDAAQSAIDALDQAIQALEEAVE